MEKDTLIEELNLLWEPVQPYLARQIEELYGRRDGQILEIGPFSGLIFTLAQKMIGRSFLIAAFPQAAVRSCQQEAQRLGLKDRVGIIESNSSLVGIADDSVDLTIFRGALFFPSLFQVDFSALYKILRRGGIALLGGGFGKFTPASTIEKIRRRSRDLNLAIGKTEIDEDQFRQDLRTRNLKGEFEFLSEGGLWVLMRK